VGAPPDVVVALVPGENAHAGARALMPAVAAGFLESVARAEVALALDGEVIGAERVAFRVIATRPDGRRVLGHVILELRGGLIARQVDVEA